MKKILKILLALIIIGGIVFCSEKLLIHKEAEDPIIQAQKEKTFVEVDNDSEENDEVFDCLIIGNSLTIEKGNIGMAASDQYHDYYYLTKTRLEEKYKTVNMSRISAILWEENRIISSRTDWINENLTPDLVSNKDVVIFQLGDNCVPTESFMESCTELVNYVKKYSPDAKMLWVGMWFINEERYEMIPTLCKNLDMEFIDITDLVQEKYRSYIGAKRVGTNGEDITVSTNEEAFHPNDEGMKIISDRICDKLDL